MALRGKKPTTVEKRLKVLLFGPPGVGKTTLAVQFPKPYVIDTERGAENDQYVKAMQAVGGQYWFSNDLDEILEEVLELGRGGHNQTTCVIDSLTVAYAEACRKALFRMAESEGKDVNDESLTSFGRNKTEPDRKVKQLFNLLMRLDMNVVVTAHAKDKYVAGSRKGERIVDGTTFDCYGKLDYMFDLVLEMQQIGEDRIAHVRKSRVEAFAFGDKIDPFSFTALAERYGSKLLMEPPKPIDLATPEQVATITRLINVAKVPSETVEKWLAKAEASSFAELSSDSVAKCIAHVQNLISGAAA